MSGILKLLGRKSNKDSPNTKEDSKAYYNTEDVENEAPNLEYRNQRRMSVSRSGRYKQKNKIRSGIWDNPGLCTDHEPERVSLNDYYEKFDDEAEKDTKYETEKAELGTDKDVEKYNVADKRTRAENDEKETGANTRNELRHENNSTSVSPSSVGQRQGVKEPDTRRLLAHRQDSDPSSRLADRADHRTDEIEDLVSQMADEMGGMIEEETAL